jgi:K+/H+ antiporter YhaU regulatory subunit KhtT
MMASTLFEDEEVLTFEAQIEIVKLPVGRLAGHTLTEAAVHSETGATVLAAIRNEDTLTDLDPHSFEFDEGDHIVLAGTSDSVRRFEAQFLRAEH